MRPTLVNRLLLLSESEVRQCLVMKDCLAANRFALQALASGQATVPTRLGLPYTPPPSPSQEDAQDWTLFKPASYNDSDHTTAAMGLKIVSIRSQNPSRQLPLVPATVLQLDASTGQVDAVLAATYLTAARTAAGSALATALTVPRCNHLVVLGAGLQAELHVHAIATALETTIERVTLINRTPDRAKSLQAKLLEQAGTATDDFPWAREVEVVRRDDELGVAEALSTADVIVTATNSTTPVLGDMGGSVLRPGCHINGIGSYTPDMQEVSARTVDRCRVIIDCQEARKVGDLKNLSQLHPVILVGDLLEQEEKSDGHGSDHDHSDDHDHTHNQPSDERAKWEAAAPLDCTFYKAVGTAIQDVVTADLVVRRARELGIGTEVSLNE